METLKASITPVSNGKTKIKEDPTAQLEMSSWQKIIFPIILVVIHQIVHILTKVSIIVQQSYRQIRLLILGRSTLQEIPVTFNSIEAICNTTLTKKPKHIAFAFLEPYKSTSCIPFHDVANLVVWSLASGASCISLYDLGGRLKREQVRLLHEIRASFERLQSGAEKIDFSRNFKVYIF